MRQFRGFGWPAVAAAVFATSVGVTGAFGTFADALLFNPLKIYEPDNLSVVGLVAPTGDQRHELTSSQYELLSDYHQLPTAAPEFSFVTAVGYEPVVADLGSGTRRVIAAFVASDYFETLGVSLERGRPFVEEDFQEGAAPVAILSRAAWTSSPEAANDLLDETVTLGGSQARVVGIAGSGVLGTSLEQIPALFVPLPVAREALRDPGYFLRPGESGTPMAWLTVLGRLGQGETLRTAETKLTDRWRQLGLVMGPRAQDPLDDVTFTLAAATEFVYRTETKVRLVQLGSVLGAAGIAMVLLGASALGIALLTRQEERRREFALRVALGATPGRILRSVLGEATIVLLLTLPVAIGIGRLVTQVASLEVPGGIHVRALGISSLGEIGVRAMTLAFAGGAAAILVLLVAAGFSASSRAGSLPGREPAGIGLSRTRRYYSVVTISVTVFLLVGSVTFIRNVADFLSLNLGFRSQQVIVASINLVEHDYAPPDARIFFDELADRLRASPRIGTVAVATYAGGMTPRGNLRLDDRELKMDSLVRYLAVDDTYFDTLGLPRLNGRLFGPADAAGGEAAIVSSSLARALDSGGDVLGRSLWLGSSGAVTIVGVVGDAVYNVDNPGRLVVYVSSRQRPGVGPIASVFLEAEDIRAAKEEAVRIVKTVDDRVSPTSIATMEERIRSRYSFQGLAGRIMGAFGGAALCLALVAIHALTASMVAAQRRELAVRAALGANAGRLLAFLGGRIAVTVGLGFGLGVSAVWIVGSLPASSWFGNAWSISLAVGQAAAVVGVATILAAAYPLVNALRGSLTAVLASE